MVAWHSFHAVCMYAINYRCAWLIWYAMKTMFVWDRDHPSPLKIDICSIIPIFACGIGPKPGDEASRIHHEAGLTSHHWSNHQGCSWPSWAEILRLPALMDLYIHPLYVLVSMILSFILNSPAPIHPLYHPLSTLSTMGFTCHFI
jgi:hypothetical protein